MAKSIPRRKKGEGLVAYHDRLSARAREADAAGQTTLSRRLQRAAGKLAAEHETVARDARGDSSGGPGTYPWQECVDDQRGRGYDDEAARKICGRIRQSSRERYPAYWEARSGNPANPLPLIPLVAAGAHLGATVAGDGVAHALALANPPSDGVPFCALALDAGPHFNNGPRDHVVVVDRGGAILEVWEIGGPPDMARFNAAHPNLPVLGPLHVLAKDVHVARKRALRMERSQKVP